MPTISIVIPIFNVERYLDDCLNSVFDQKTSDIEVIMVNDCSTDGSRDIASKYIKKHPEAVLIDHKINSGLGPARNSAMAIATGDYLMMVDSDDWLEKDAIRTVLDTINEGEFDIAQFGCNKVHQDRSEMNLYTEFRGAKSLQRKKQVLLQLPNYAWLKVYRRSFIEHHNLKFQNIYYEDIPWSISSVLAAQSIECRADVIYNYRQRPESIIDTRSERHLDLLKAYDVLFKEIDLENIAKPLKNALHNSFITAAYYLHRNKHQRLEQKHIRFFDTIYLNVLRNYNITPHSMSAFAMHMITRLQVLIRN